MPEESWRFSIEVLDTKGHAVFKYEGHTRESRGKARADATGQCLAAILQKHPEVETHYMRGDSTSGYSARYVTKQKSVTC
jgi:hypothetical protein